MFRLYGFVCIVYTSKGNQMCDRVTPAAIRFYNVIVKNLLRTQTGSLIVMSKIKSTSKLLRTSEMFLIFPPVQDFCFLSYRTFLYGNGLLSSVVPFREAMWSYHESVSATVCWFLRKRTVLVISRSLCHVIFLSSLSIRCRRKSSNFVLDISYPQMLRNMVFFVSEPPKSVRPRIWVPLFTRSRWR